MLAQCPGCGNAYVRRSDDTAETITCRRCLLVFRPVKEPPPDPIVPFPTIQPIIVTSLPTDFEIQLEADQADETDHVHEVEHIEVLDAPAEPSPASMPMDQWTPKSRPPESLQLDDMPTLTPLDDQVEVVDAPALPDKDQPIRAIDEAEEIVLEPVPEPAAKPALKLDDVEVVDMAPPPLQQAVQATAPITAPVPPPLEFSDPEDYREPPPRRDVARRIDIRKRNATKGAAVPAGVWIGLGIGAFAVLLLVLVIIMVSGSSRDGDPVVAKKQQPAPVPPENFLPPQDDWPQPPDQRGPAPWLPPPRAGLEPPPAATQLDGLVAYWPLDEGKGRGVADVSSNKLRSTLVGGWWIDGVRGKAILFDGRRDYLDLGDAPVLNFPSDGPFTLAGWLATRQQDGYVLAFRNPRHLAPLVQVKLSGGSICGVVRGDGDERGEARVGLARAADGRWHHFAVVRHPGGWVECVLDGKSLDKRRGTNSAGPITTTVRSVGCERSLAINQPSSAAYFACAIDELCVFNRALTLQEIGTLAGK